MKKIKFTILILLFILISGCSQKNDEEITIDYTENTIEEDKIQENNKEDLHEIKISDLEKEDLEEVQKDDIAEKATSTIITGDNNIQIYDIKNGDLVSSPLIIKGQAKIEEKKLIIELRNKDHFALVKEVVNVYKKEKNEWGEYSVTLNFEFSNTKEGFIAVYEEDIEDSLLEIPVKFSVVE